MSLRWPARACTTLLVVGCAASSAPTERNEATSSERPHATEHHAPSHPPAPAAATTRARATVDDPLAWRPSRTRAVIAGVLRWEDPEVTSFSPIDRKDAELAEVLRARGVPASNVTTLLDEAARGEAVLEAVEAQARAAEPGSTLIVYYAGHGTRSASGEIGLLGYDAGTKGRISMASLTRALDGFRGERVLLMADCCHSGGLAEVAHALETRGVHAAAVTSAEASNTSTANWTFTQSVIDALAGDGLADHDGDGRVALGELATEVRHAMKHRERQRAGVALGRVGGDLVLGPVTLPAPPRAGAAPSPAPGDYVVASLDGHEATARVREQRGRVLALELYDYAVKSTVHLPIERVRPVRFERYEPGAALRVAWGGRTWDATVLRVEDDFHLITYPGWSSWWDEWIASDRVVGRR